MPKIYFKFFQRILGKLKLLTFPLPPCSLQSLTKEQYKGCPKSHCAKVRAYCPACDHLIRKISSGMSQKSGSLEEFKSFSEIEVEN